MFCRYFLLTQASPGAPNTLVCERSLTPHTYMLAGAVARVTAIREESFE